MSTLKIAIASGKGGTGKTTVATNLAFVAAERGISVAYVDCDVEEPNGHIFLRPTISERRAVTRLTVRVDAQRCDHCGKCEQVCQFSAIVRIGEKVVTYPQLCQGCGGCLLFCPRKAIIEEPIEVGEVACGSAGAIRFAQGTLKIGEPKSTGLIRAVKETAGAQGLVILDAPPGAACPVVETIRGADLVLLVAEPTPFGFHDFQLVFEVVRNMGIQPAVVINRADLGDGQLRHFCEDRGIPIIAEIPEDRVLAESNARGLLAAEVFGKYAAIFDAILDQLWVPEYDHTTAAEAAGEARLMIHKPRQLAVISGKGGTGKTSVTASLAALAGRVVLADCDVDAPNLHLVLAPRPRLTETFCGGKRAIIDARRCASCGRCELVCRFGAISLSGPGNGAVDATYCVDEFACEGCGVCALVCPAAAITLSDAINGQWFISDTRLGPMVHARLSPGHENSGKLVSLVRTQARKLAAQTHARWIFIDGAPGIGCSVIASISGVDQVLVVTEPSKSGLHDLERALDLAAHFRIPSAVCVNKWDIEPDVTRSIESVAEQRGATIAGRVRYDRAVVEAQIRGLSIVEFCSNGVSAELREIWKHVSGTATPALQEKNS